MWIRKLYVSVMLQIIARALCALSRVDKEAQHELKGLPKQFFIEMMVMHSNLGFVIHTTDEHQLAYYPHPRSELQSIDLSLKFKHREHAFLVFSFQESAAEAFTKDRVIADGELAASIRFTRVLNRMQSIILPKFIAKRAIKRYPSDLGLFEKLTLAFKVYALIAKQLLLGK